MNPEAKEAIAMNENTPRFNYFELSNGRAFGLVSMEFTIDEFWDYILKNEPGCWNTFLVKAKRHGTAESDRHE